MWAFLRRNISLYWILAGALGGTSEVMAAEAGNAAVHTGPPPSWVQMVEADSDTNGLSGEGSGGELFRLVDSQVNVAQEEKYSHIVKEITSEGGIQSGANLKFNWDPSYQELIIHHIFVERGAERFDQLDASRFKVIQQETDLDRQVYNGALSAVLFLDDVRVGDRIEYDYTVRGRNPSLKGKYEDSFLMGWPVPVLRQRVRVLWPAGRTLKFVLHGADDVPQTFRHHGVDEYVWEVRGEPAVMVEDEIPTWYAPYPWLQLTEFTNWAELADWANGLFAGGDPEAPELRPEILALRRLGLGPEETVQRALEFVQTKVRYLGVEFGPNSYVPTDPAKVLQRRFGDCKDKAFLLCTLLQGLGFDASPVLVSAGFRQRLPVLLPAPHDFDHVIVRVVVGRKTFWLDPTRSYQRGPMAERYRPRFGFGLPATAEATDLVAIPDSGAGSAFTVTKEIYRVGAQQAPTQLSVTSTFNGFDAEWMRAVLDSEGRDRLAKIYLNDLARRYPGAVLSAPISVIDSSNEDRLTLAETYTISNFWKLSANQQVYRGEFYPEGIHQWIVPPRTTLRRMPLELSFPRRREIETTIELPRRFRLSGDTNVIEGPGARLRVERTFHGQTVNLRYDYCTRTDFVSVAQAPEYLASLDRMENELGYVLNWQSMDSIGKSGQFNWPIFLLATIYALAVAGGAGWFGYKQCSATVAVSSGLAPRLNGENLNGLGGWLILVGLGLIISPIRILIQVGRASQNFSLWRWHGLTQPGGVSYNPLWAPLLTFELLGQITLIIVALMLLVLFFQRRRVFPRWFIALQLLNALFVLGDMVGVHFLGISSAATMAIRTRNIASVLVGCSIWIPYMLVSQRVKATFVR
ncbi:MAG TPA: DUF3857 domain-containing protein [Verrucomicrobiae bacterium]|nr:DUF3857 domain-containing protein [Verrucomicrobiae bacterium]